ncbi:MAG: hypothetical protein K6G89_07675 [Clostridia bacterium]|nr:hypothetical protein [Clostridia bacterium]
MIKKILKAALLLAVLGIAGIFAFGCTPGSDPAANTDAPAVPTQAPVVFKDYDGPYGETITTAAKYANTVNGYYNSNSKSSYILENTNSKLVYGLTPVEGFSGVRSLYNSNGGEYIANTMDSYVKMDTGKTFFSTGSVARANLYDQGIYYYNLHILDHTFANDENSLAAKLSLPLDDCGGTHDLTKPIYGEDGSVSATVTSIHDPYIYFNLPQGKYDLDNYDAFYITMKCTGAGDAEIFYVAGKLTNFVGESSLHCKLIADGEYHSYLVYFDNNTNLKNYITGFRIDAGGYVGEEITIKDFSIVKVSEDVPPFLLDRDYNVYSDKIHENIRFLATSDTTSVTAVGNVTEIPAEKVDKFVVNDSTGPHYSLDEVDWSTAAYAGFDVKDVGVFGIVLVSDDKYSGTLTVTLEDGVYKIVQELPVDGSRIKKSKSIYMARRIYVDETHDFSGFLREAYYERAPLEFTVDKGGSSKRSSFKGYDALTGAYKVLINGPQGFDEPYERPLEEHKVKFTANPSGGKRTIYVIGETENSGCLECAVLLDASGVLLPVNVEACKNFAHDGEELTYTDNDSYGYGLSVFPMVVGDDTDNTVTLCDLYEQWGNYRLKQVTSIRFHSAYYHLSLGVTETNCIHLYYAATRLPDHRGLSSLYWADDYVDVVDKNGDPTGHKVKKGQQPQHSNNGTHLFLQYFDSDGNFNSYENVGRTVISSCGPTLADITLCYSSYDGKVFETYRHVEMPDTDENRAYYEVTYEFLSDVTINNVREDLILYAFSQPYDKFGYLDKDNNPVIEDTSDTKRIIPLGNDFPYFDYFHKTTDNPKAYTESDSSSNLSFFLKSYDIVIGGKPYTGGFVVREGESTAAFTLDIAGSTTFKKGDRISFVCILMPWGSYFSENDDNVRMVRENTLKNPVKVETSNGTVLPDDIVPTMSSNDGKSLEFTISGGLNNVRDLPGYATKEYTAYKVSWERDHNVTVVAKGFKNPTVPKIYEKIGGEWVPYEFASSLGYDGYMVNYADDGTFTYSFTITMTEGNERTFRIES